MIERDIENYLKAQINSINGLTFKFSSPGNAGVPDRIVIHKSKVVFVELKAPGKKVRKLQQYQIDKIRKHGIDVVVIDSIKGVDEFVIKLERDGNK